MKNKKEYVLFEKKTVPVLLFGRKLFLAESNTKDFIDYTKFIIENNQNKDTDYILFQAAHILHCALKYNLEVIPWYRFIKKFVLKFLISERYIMNTLGQSELENYVNLVLKLEGLLVDDPDKKKLKNNMNSEYLGAEQGYSLLMCFFGWSIEQIHNLPISMYFVFTNEALNIATLNAGGKYRFANEDDRIKYKKMVAFHEIQQLKKVGKWH